MPELADDQVRVGFFEHLGQQGEMVILDEDNGPPVPQFVQNDVGKLPVYLAIDLPLGGGKLGAGIADVAQGPEGLIGEAIVVAFFFFPGQPEPAQLIFGVFGGHHDGILPHHGLLVGFATTGGHPGAAGGLHQGIQGDGHTAGGHNDLYLPAPVDMHIGFAVGHQDELVVTKLLLNQIL